MNNSFAWGSSGYAGTRGALRLLCAKLYLLNQFSLPPLIICTCQGSDTLDSLPAVGEQRQDDDTVANSADLATGHWCELHSQRPCFCTSGNRFNCVHCEVLQHLIPLCLNTLFHSTQWMAGRQMKSNVWELTNVVARLACVCLHVHMHACMWILEFVCVHVRVRHLIVIVRVRVIG